MGLFRDRETELSQLQRLALQIKEPSRRQKLDASTWPLAMLAYALEMSEDPALLGEQSREVYAAFAAHVAPTARKSSLAQLGQFVSSRRGMGWRALLLYAVGEADEPELSARAATLALTLAPSGEEERFVGAAAVVQLVAQAPSAPPAILSALLDISDLRLLPLLDPLYSVSQAHAETLLVGLHGTLNSLSSAFLLQLLEAQPSLAASITATLMRLAEHTPLVADLVYPMPTWAFAQPAPQPLHAWTLPEYMERMRPRLAPHLSPEQLRSLENVATNK